MKRAFGRTEQSLNNFVKAVDQRRFDLPAGDSEAENAIECISGQVYKEASEPISYVTRLFKRDFS